MNEVIDKYIRELETYNQQLQRQIEFIENFFIVKIKSLKETGDDCGMWISLRELEAFITNILAMEDQPNEDTNDTKIKPY